MPSTVEQLSPSRVKITIEVPFVDLQTSMEKAYAEIANQVSIPGFRKGKVPPRVIDQRMGRGAVINEAFNDALPEIYGKAVVDNNLTPLAQPDIEVTKLEDGDVIEFTAEVDVRPDFTLPETSGITATVDAVEVDEEQLTEQLDTLRQRFGTMATVERPAETGDVVVISLVATQDGAPLADATAEDISYRLGEGGMIDGLDEAVTGLSAGESATFASDLVGGDHAGEEAQISVSVAKVQVQELPEADDEFAQMASEYDTIDELTDNLRERLTGMARVEQASQARDRVLEQVIAEVDFEVPAGVLSTEVEARRNQITQQLAQAGMTLDAYLVEAEDGKSADDFWADMDQRSADALKAQIVLDKLAEESNVQVDQNDLTQHIMRIAQQNRQSPDEVAKHMVEHNHLTEYMTEIRRGKALAAIVESATVSDSNGDLVDLANLRQDGSIADPAAEAEIEGEIEGEVLDAPVDVVEPEAADETEGSEQK